MKTGSSGSTPEWLLQKVPGVGPKIHIAQVVLMVRYLAWRVNTSNDSFGVRRKQRKWENTLTKKYIVDSRVFFCCIILFRSEDDIPLPLKETSSRDAWVA